MPNQVVNSKDDELIGFEEDHADEDTLHAQEERILEEKQRREQEELKQRHEAEKHRMKMRKSSKAGSGRSTLGRGASHKSLTSEGCGYVDAKQCHVWRALSSSATLARV